MLALAISVLWGLIGLVVLVGIGWVILWVLNALGIIIPPMVIKLAMIILGLLVLIWILGLLASGSMSFPGMTGTGAHRVSMEQIEHYTQMPIGDMIGHKELLLAA